MLNLITAAYPDIKKENRNHLQAKAFESVLTCEQIQKIYDLVIEIKLFKLPLTVTDLDKLFSNSLTNPLHVSNNINLATLFNCLSNAKYITNEWQSVIEENKCFLGTRGAKMIANTLAVSNNKKDSRSDVYRKIDVAIKELDKPVN